jgi:N-acylneuraminate cytidylyltransferase
VQSSDLIDALALLMRDNRDYVFAGGRFAFPVERGFRLSAGGTVEPMFPEYRMTRSQDLLPAFHDAGQFYWGRTEAWIEERPIFGPSASFVEIPPWRMQDIDTEDDWHRAELLFEVMRRAER